jgi:D-lactate dehydrogenase
MALFAQLNQQRQLSLINHLGVRLGDKPEAMLQRLALGQFSAADIQNDSSCRGSDCDYEQRVRAIDADSPARFNADPSRLFEASGSAGRVAVFAVRLDTFPKDRETRVFYIGTRDPTELTALRRHMLGRFQSLPVAAEYLHGDLFDVAERYGKDTFQAIRYLGAHRLPAFFRFRRAWDSFASRMPLGLPGSSDTWLQLLSLASAHHLPVRMREFRDRFSHHLILKTADHGIAEAADYLRSIYPSSSGDYFECTAAEAAKAFLHRFVAASAAMRYHAIHADEVGALISLDIALKRNEREWFEALPTEIHTDLVGALYYGHFFCHVFHQDYLVRKGADVAALEHRLRLFQDDRGAEYPAEHNVGHLYPAKLPLSKFYRQLDPCNGFNPGIGQTSKLPYWGD